MVIGLERKAPSKPFRMHMDVYGCIFKLSRPSAQVCTYQPMFWTCGWENLHMTNDLPVVFKDSKKLDTLCVNQPSPDSSSQEGFKAKCGIQRHPKCQFDGMITGTIHTHTYMEETLSQSQSLSVARRNQSMGWPEIWYLWIPFRFYVVFSLVRPKMPKSFFACEECPILGLGYWYSFKPSTIASDAPSERATSPWTSIPRGSTGIICWCWWIHEDPSA